MILRESLISGLHLILVIRNQFVKINFFNSDIADNISWLP